MKIIQIDGIKGLITVAFVALGLFSGFIVSPGFVAMYLWNKYLAAAYLLPQINLFQGILLWAIAVIVYFILTKDGFAVSFGSTKELSDEELNAIIQKARMSSHMRMMNNIMSKSDMFQSLHKNPFINNDDNKKEDKFNNLK